MNEAASLAKAFGYQVRAYGGDFRSVDLVKEVHTGHGDETVLIGLSITRDKQGDWYAEVNHLPTATMAIVRSLSFSWPHKNFERLFEVPVTKMALLYRANQEL